MVDRYTRQQYTWNSLIIPLGQAVALEELGLAGDYVRVDEASDAKAHVFVRLEDPNGSTRRKLRLGGEIDGAEFANLFLDYPEQRNDDGEPKWVKLLVGTTYGAVKFGNPDPTEVDISGTVAVRPGIITQNGSQRPDSRFWVSLYLRPEPGFTPQKFRYGDTLEEYAALNFFGAKDVEWDGELFLVRGKPGNESTWREYDADWSFIQELPAPESGFATQTFAFGETAADVFWLEDSGGMRYKYGPRNGDGSAANTAWEQTPNGNDVSNADGLTSAGDTLYWYAINDNAIYSSSIADAANGKPSWTLLADSDDDNEINSAGKLAWANGLLHFLQQNDSALIALDLSKAKGSRAVYKRYVPGHAPQAMTAKGGEIYTIDMSSNEVPRRLFALEEIEVNIKADAIAAQCALGAGLVAQRYSYTAATVTRQSGKLGQIIASGELLRFALALFSSRLDAPDDYLDHVFGIEINDGDGPGLAKQYADRSFAAAGVADDFTMRLPGVISLWIDTELFN